MDQYDFNEPIKIKFRSISKTSSINTYFTQFIIRLYFEFLSQNELLYQFVSGKDLFLKRDRCQLLELRSPRSFLVVVS